MKTIRDLYWAVAYDFIIPTIACDGKLDTRGIMQYIAKEMIIRGEM